MNLRVESTADRQFATNSFLVEDDDTHDAVIIDANLEPELMVDLVKKRGSKIKAILLTHTDVDHIAGLPLLLQELGLVPVAVHDAERSVITESKPLRRQFPVQLPPIETVTALAESEKFRAHPDTAPVGSR